MDSTESMALLAIQRTYENSWHDSTGREYAPFYVDRVQEELSRVGLEGEHLDGIEMPVMVCWFPTLYEQDWAALTAARTVFVAVNRKAEAPTQARTTLLSDTELRHIFTREILERLRPERAADYPLPLTAIEFDNPDEDSSRPERWTAITNVGLLSHVVRRCVFGPRELLTDMSRGLPRGAMPADADLFMREQLDLEAIYAAEPPEEMEYSDISNDRFPRNVEPLVERFWQDYGRATVEILGRLQPYAAHHEVLETLRDEWMGQRGTLWYRALFEGSGLYWSIKRTFEERRRDAPETEVVAAWRELEGPRREEFTGARQAALPPIPAAWDLSVDQVYRNTYMTHACELGLMLTFASVALESNATMTGVS